MQRTSALRVGLLAAAFALVVGPGGAVEFEIFRALETAQGIPMVAFNSVRDEYLVVWLDHETSTMSGRRVVPRSLREVELGPVREVALLAWPASLEFNPRRREYLLLTVELSPLGKQILMATRIRPGGKVRGERRRVSEPTDGGPIPGADLLYVPTRKRWLAVWVEEGSGIKARFLRGKDVLPDGPEILIAAPTWDVSLAHPSLAYGSTSNEILVAFRDDFAKEIRVQRLDVFGRRIGPSQTLNHGDAIVSAPVAIDLSTRDRWFVTWEENARVYGRFVSRDGSLGELRRFQNRFAFLPGAAYSEVADRFLLSWDDVGIRGRWFRPSGEPDSRRFRVSRSGGFQSFFSTDNVTACSDQARYCLAVWEGSFGVSGNLLRVP